MRPVRYTIVVRGRLSQRFASCVPGHRCGCRPRRDPDRHRSAGPEPVLRTARTPSQPRGRAGLRPRGEPRQHDHQAGPVTGDTRGMEKPVTRQEPPARRLRRHARLIVGAGIGGLTAAVALRRAGIDAVVLERAPELREVGAGISLWPNAINTLRRLGRRRRRRGRRTRGHRQRRSETGEARRCTGRRPTRWRHASGRR